ncbi:hypothetical protein GO986_09425 [Deinococcus sp. HMF7620]|uniref:AAA+ ATPase domain-containing protein n=1 Tax=Deinococcus arboris TaxID=2682977 RepID=A0A7C9M680_9DEIO|nr:hypothetical protein [Deinococcus arboris]MVN86985.1 hypothetical protein [Deinococcus arboris]
MSNLSFPPSPLLQPAPVTLRTLGDLHLGDFRKVKSLLMLAIVALDGPTSRRHLAALLWPRAAKPEASLRVALHALRESCPGALSGEERLDTALPCDAAALLTLRGEAAVQAYSGAFLPDLKVEGVSAEFEEWVEGWRQRLARHVQSEALLLAERSEPGQAAQWAARAYDLPGAPPAEPDTLRRLLALSAPASALEAALRTELRELTGRRATDSLPAPRRATRMMGREAELDTLLAWATQAGGGVAAVTGPGGIGKSTLARALLRELTVLGRAVTLVDTEGVTHASEVAARLAAARGQPGGDWAALGGSLKEGAVVLLDGLDDLDDLEDLRRGLTQLPGTRWVLTGRRSRLGRTTAPQARGDLLLALGGLERPPPEASWLDVGVCSAVQVFVREAARVRRDFVLNAQNAGLVASLTRRLMGHPLALTLAASWLRVEDLDAVHARMLQEAGALRTADGDGDGRRGLQVAAQRSWAMLSPALQAAALRLSAGADFDPADSAALGVPADAVDALLGHAFLEAYLPGSERLRLYPALDGLMGAQAALHPALYREAQAAHAQHHLGRFLALAPEDPATDPERSNLHLAMQAALRGGTLAAAHAEHLLAHYDRRGMHAAGMDALFALSDLAEEVSAPPEVQAALQVGCMWLAYRAGRLLDAQTLAAAFLQGPLATLPGSRMKVLNTLASVRGVQGQMRASADLTRQALSLAQSLGDEARERFYRLSLLSSLSFLGEEEELQRQMQVVEAGLSELPEAQAWQTRQTLLHLRALSHVADAALLREAEAIAQWAADRGHVFLSVHALLNGTAAALTLTQWRDAERWLEQARRLVDTTQPSELAVELLRFDAQVKYAKGRSPQARRAARDAAALIRQRGNPWEAYELLLVTAPDLSSCGPEPLGTFLCQLAGSPNVHMEQRRRARALLTGLSWPVPVLSSEAAAPLHQTLTAWLEQQLS